MVICSRLALGHRQAAPSQRLLSCLACPSSDEYKASQLLNTGRLCKLRSLSRPQSSETSFTLRSVLQVTSACHRGSQSGTSCDLGLFSSHHATTSYGPTHDLRLRTSHTDGSGLAHVQAAPTSGLERVWTTPKDKIHAPKVSQPNGWILSDILKLNSRLVSTQKKKNHAFAAPSVTRGVCKMFSIPCLTIPKPWRQVHAPSTTWS